MTKEQALKICGGLSAPSKMPCKSYSIPVRFCKVGLKLQSIEKSTCFACYADRGCYNFKSTQNAMLRRYKSLKNNRWVDAIVFLISAQRKKDFFRWHDSGDIQGIFHLENICEVARRLPQTSFWLPTREYGMIREYKKRGGVIPENLTIRLSSYFVDAPLPISVMRELDLVGSGVTTTQKEERICPAPQQDGKCGSCRACWDKNVKGVFYVKH